MAKKKKHYFLQIFVILAIGVLLLYLFISFYCNQFVDSEKRVAISDADTYSQNVIKAMDGAEQVTRVLEYCLISLNADTSFFEGTAKDMYSRLDYVNSIQLAPNGVVSDIYPLKGNEKGFIDLMHDETRGPIVRYGKEKNVVTSQGPFDLKQGGKGIAIRNPVYLSDGSFWGFTIVIINTDQLIDNITKMMDKKDYNYLLEKANPLDSKNFQTVTESGQLTEPVTFTFKSGASQWRLSIEPRAKWLQFQDYMIIMFLGLAVVILITWLSYMLMLNHDRQIALLEAANVDFLTGILNRQGLDEAAALYFGKNSKKPFVAVMLDIDNFKIINDCYGHGIGDRALKALSSALKNTFSNDEIVGRYGGDEFFVLLKNKTPDQIQDSLKKLINTEIRYKTGINTYDVLSISIGYASYPTDSDDPEEVVTMADQALYNSKEHGKGRFEGYKKD